MSSATDTSQKVLPAQIDFLTIYNPSLGNTDETLDDQIVYYSSLESRKRARRQSRSPTKSLQALTQNDKNERLRQIGLAQGMVNFGKDFSDGKSVDVIETEKSRIILHELESGWWVLASIQLTRLPIKRKAAVSPKSSQDPTVEYSSREIKPAALLRQDLLRAHATFLLHHASSLSALFVRIKRSKFMVILGTYWDSFLSTWNPMLHGNPAVNIYGGIKLAGSGELGMGVGEEDRGSGEREVLEGFVGRIEGLVDLVVSRFGDPEPATLDIEKGSGQDERSSRWLGTGADPGDGDGAVFLGVGALSRNSLRDMTYWMEDLYSWGPYAYAVIQNPSSTRRARRKDRNRATTTEVASHPKIPDETSIGPLSPSASSKGKTKAHGVPNLPSPGSEVSEAPLNCGRPEQSKTFGLKERRPTLHRARSSGSSARSTKTNNLFSFMKFGYGTHWTLSPMPVQATHEYAGTLPQLGMEIPGKVTDSVLSKNDSSPESHPAVRGIDTSMYPKNDSVGHFLIGLLGDLDNEEEHDMEDATADEETEGKGNNRILLRTVTVELEREGDARAEADISIDFGNDDNRADSSQHTNTSKGSYESQDRNKSKKVRIVVYVSKPFIYAFIFELRTDSLSLSSLYRSLHHQLGPLQKPLSASTQHRLSRPDISASSNENTKMHDTKTPIYDLIWDPKLMTITSTIPSIPEPSYYEADAIVWSRLEALTTHTQIVNTYALTRGDRLELERTSKTSRGWWMVWTRIPDPDSQSEKEYALTFSGRGSVSSNLKSGLGSEKKGTIDSTATSSMKNSALSGPAHPYYATIPEIILKDKEIILIRRASDFVDGKQTSGRFGGMGGGDSWGTAPAKLAQGIGVDTRRYIEGLLTIHS